MAFINRCMTLKTRLYYNIGWQFTLHRSRRILAPSSNEVSCGVRPPRNRIIGGNEATPHSWPWQCSLQLNHKHICGCSVISSTWVITAAHCKFYEDACENVHEAPTEALSVVVGAHYIDRCEASQRRHYIREAVLHERFSKQTYHNDILLLRLNTSVQFSDDVRPICVDDSEFPDNTRCIATGWGTVKVDTYVEPGNLQQVAVKTISPAICGQSDWLGTNFDKETMICAGYAEGGKDTCLGDSGGPLQCPAPDGRWKLIGLISFGDGCAESKKPGVYTRVKHFIDWIKERVDDPRDWPRGGLSPEDYVNSIAPAAQRYLTDFITSFFAKLRNSTF